jgi:hypothetical protein
VENCAKPGDPPQVDIPIVDPATETKPTVDRSES